MHSIFFRFLLHKNPKSTNRPGYSVRQWLNWTRVKLWRTVNSFKIKYNTYAFSLIKHFNQNTSLYIFCILIQLINLIY